MNVREICTELEKSIEMLKQHTRIKATPRLDATLKKLSEFDHKYFNGGSKALYDIDPSEDLIRYTTEAFIFFSITKLILSLKSNEIPRGVLGRYLNGYATPWLGENDQTSESQNHLVELQLASSLYESGFNVVGFNDVSIKDKFHNNIHFQCKRISSLDHISFNVKKAYDQLVKHKQLINNNYGMIAINLDRALQTTKQMYWECGISAVEENEEKMARYIKENSQNHLSCVRHQNVLGIVYFVNWIWIPERFEGGMRPLISKWYYKNSHLNIDMRANKVFETLTENIKS